jgi:hypothetical protein
MQLIFISFVIILLSCGALAIGQLFGRKPINGGCRPSSASHCAQTESCSLRCIKRRQQPVQEN